MKEAEIQADKFRSDAAHIQPVCLQSSETVTELSTIVEEVVAYLKNYAIGETPSVNIDRALAEAESHWQYISAIDPSVRKANAIRELEYNHPQFHLFGIIFTSFV